MGSELRSVESFSDSVDSQSVSQSDDGCVDVLLAGAEQVCIFSPLIPHTSREESIALPGQWSPLTPLYRVV